MKVLKWIIDVLAASLLLMTTFISCNLVFEPVYVLIVTLVLYTFQIIVLKNFDK